MVNTKKDKATPKDVSGNKETPPLQPQDTTDPIISTPPAAPVVTNLGTPTNVGSSATPLRTEEDVS